MMLEEDLTHAYNTPLPQTQERDFQLWARQHGRLGDLYDYDLRAAWKASAKEAQNGHLPDTYKKPNHPTFSQESQYSRGQTVGGTWAQTPDKRWSFKPSPYNLHSFGPDRLKSYFHEREPDAVLLLP